MKNLLLTLGTLALCAACSQTPKPFVLEGSFKNCRSDYAILINGEIGLKDTVRIAPDGTFTYEKVMPEPAFAFLSFTNQEAVGALLTINGTTNRLEADLDDPATWKFTGDLEKALPLYNELSGALTGHIEAPASTFAAYEADLRQVSDSLMGVAGQFPNEDFQQLMQHTFDSSIGWALIGYSDYLTGAGEALDSDPDYTAYMENINLNDTLNSDFAYIYLYWKARCKSGDGRASYLDMLQALQAKATDPVARERMTKRLMIEYDANGDPQLDSVCALAESMLPDEKDKEWIRQKQTTLKGTMPGSPAIDCEWTDPQGNTSRLSDLFGKVIYLDVWATWCGPCCAEIPYLEKLVERFKGDSRIEFVSVSVDSNKEAWLKKLEADKPAWKQFLCRNFTELYGIAGIPRFILIGKDGKLIAPSAPRPSDEGIDAFLKEYLK